MINHQKILFIFLILFSCQSSSIGLQYIPFQDTKYENDLTNAEQVIIYENRLDIDSKYVEMGVLILNNRISKKNIQKIKIEAFNKKADGFIIEGKNIVLIKLIEEEFDDEDKSDYGI